jgi:hypothetical protein
MKATICGSSIAHESISRIITSLTPGSLPEQFLWYIYRGIDIKKGISKSAKFHPKYRFSKAPYSLICHLEVLAVDLLEIAATHRRSLFPSK